LEIISPLHNFYQTQDHGYYICTQGHRENQHNQPGFAPPKVNMQAMPDSRQQSFEEIYGPPENFLEIEVILPS